MALVAVNMPDSACGSCGDYLFTKHSRPHKAGSLNADFHPTKEHPSGDSEQTAESDHTANPARSSQLPCSGPHCRQNRQQPTQPAGPVPAPSNLPTDGLKRQADAFPVTQNLDSDWGTETAIARAGIPMPTERPPEEAR